LTHRWSKIVAGLVEGRAQTDNGLYEASRALSETEAMESLTPLLSLEVPHAVRAPSILGQIEAAMVRPA